MHANAPSLATDGDPRLGKAGFPFYPLISLLATFAPARATFQVTNLRFELANGENAMPGRKAAVSDEPTFETLLLWWMGDQQTKADAGYFAAERKQALLRLKRDKVTLYNTKWLSEAIPPEQRHPTKWLSEAIPPEQRHPALSWNHHLKVKTLSKEDRRFWLELAAKNNLSTRQLSDQIRKGRSAN